jgi:hypothetical protein
VTASLLIVAALSGLTAQEYKKRNRDARLPGMQGAITFLESRRNVDEPLIVCNPMLYIPMVAHTHHRERIYNWGSRNAYPFFQGTAVTREDEYFSDQNLREFSGDTLWTFDAERWFNHTWRVSVPPDWKEAEQFRFPEFNAEFVIRRYVRDLPTAAADISASP